MDAITPADILAWTRVDLAALGYDGDPELQELIDQAVSYVEQVTGRVPLTSVPTELEPLARQAVRMRVEQLAEQATADSVEDAADELVESFTTPGYSETRMREARERVAVVVNAWRALNDVLLLLMTPEKRDEYLGYLTGVHPPAFATTEIDWQGDFAWYGAPSWPGWGYE